MANDDFFTATGVWAAVEANAADITNGTFTVFSHTSTRVWFKKATTAPAALDEGPSFFHSPTESLKFALGAAEKLFCRTNGDSVIIGVIPG